MPSLLPVFSSIPFNKLPLCRGSTTFAVSRHLKCHQQKRSLATLIKGQEAAKKILSQVSQDLEVLKSAGIKPKVVVGVVGNDPASRIYLNRKKAAALKAGLDFEEIQLPDTVQMPEMLSTIKDLNHDRSVNGIIIQLPIPKHLDEQVGSSINF